jgi:signal transduction histidine kinase
MNDDPFATDRYQVVGQKRPERGKFGRRSMNHFQKKEQWRNAANVEGTYQPPTKTRGDTNAAIASSNLAFGRGTCTLAEAPFDSFLEPVADGALSAGNGARPRYESALSLSARLLQAQDGERRRISRELHDSVGQSLTVILMNLEVLSRTVTDKRLEETIDVVKDVSREVRTISYLMHPPMLDLSGLETAINCCAEGFSKRSGIRTEVESVQELPRLPIEKETALYRMVQECLTNVHRHSGASNAWIRIGVNEGQLRLEVEDNGKGFTAEDVHASPDTPVSLGVGIPAMRERMRELGGSLRIQSSKHGTKVTAVLSLTGTNKATCSRLGSTHRLRPEIAKLMNDAANGRLFK